MEEQQQSNAPLEENSTQSEEQTYGITDEIISENTDNEITDQNTRPIIESKPESIAAITELYVSEEAEDHTEGFDYTGSSKKELLDELKKIRLEQALKVSKQQLASIKESFEAVFYAERDEARKIFTEAGGEKDGFEYQDLDAKSFFDLLKDINEQRRKHKNNQEEQRVSNTQKKKQLLDQLRNLVDKEESKNTFNQIKELQKNWKETGNVAQADFYELNASYSALLDRYYSFRSIYFDLKNLDKGKNLTQKTVLLQEVIALMSYENTLEAVKKLNEIHALYKNIGPVPENESEALWEKFKTATDQVRDKRTAHIELFKVELQANLDAKKRLLQKIAPYTQVQVQSAKEWVKLTDELLAIQEEWKKAGLVPEDNKKEINDQFWALCRAFYNNKNVFFGGLDNERKENHTKKLVLIEKVKALKDSEDFRNTADQIKRIQEDWKKIGQSPKAVHESVFQDFRTECDYFFNKRSQNFEAKDKEYAANLEVKKTIVSKIESLLDKTQKEEFETLIKSYFAAGFVTKEAMNSLQKSFLTATNLYISKLDDLSSDEIQGLKLSVELGAVRGTPAEKDFIADKTKGLRNKISALQDEMYTLKNNVEFFANSKNIATIRAEVDKKVQDLEQEADRIKEQLKVLRTQA